MKIAFLLGGVPGSGKSSVARSIACTETAGDGDFLTGDFWTDKSVTYYGLKGQDYICAAIHSTDEYFMKDGEYKFNPRQLGIFHNANFKAFRSSCEAGIQVVICDNTNTTRKEWKKYAKCAEGHGYIVAHVTMPHPHPDVAAERNTHGVPKEAIERMIRRWDNDRS